MKKLFFIFFCIVATLFVSTPSVYSAEPPRSKFQKLMKKAGRYVEKEFDKAVKVEEAEKMTVKSEIEGLVVDVKSCKADANGNVIISFTLENTTTTPAEEPSLPPGGRYVKVFDNVGNSYDPDNIRFAKGRNDYSTGWCSVDLPSKVVLKYRMKIMDIDPEATVLKEVMITVYEPLHTQRRFNGKVYIRNLPITREGAE